MENKPELVHFQITRNCNLRCYFCGQWGKKGFFSDASGEEMTLDDWKNLALDLKKSYEPLPHIMLWGGEPLVCPFFDELVMFLKEQGFTLGMVTNGTLLDKHLELIKEAFKIVYVSIDGPKELHDSIRGKGIYDKVAANVRMLSNSQVKVVVMSVLSPPLLKLLENFPHEMAALGTDELYLQDYIRLTDAEAAAYKKWMKESFGIHATEIDAWVQALPQGYEKEKNDALKTVLQKDYPISVYHPRHKATGCLCKSPYKHIHVSWNGNVMYCTDFYDFSAGNVKKTAVAEIFENEITEKFRNELDLNSACAHCAWRNNESFYL